MKTTAEFELSPDFDSKLAAKVFQIMGAAAEAWGKSQTFPPYLTKQEACKFANISNGTLNVWIDEGLRVSQIRGTIRIKRDDISKFLEEHSF